MKTLKFLVGMMTTAALVVAVGCSSMKSERTSRSHDSDRVASRDSTMTNKSVETTSSTKSAPEPVAVAPAPAYTAPASPAPSASNSAMNSSPSTSAPVQSAPERVAKADRG